MTDWNAAQYLQFKAERTQPAIDLARRLAHLAPRKILDIGCGPGNSTHIRAQHFPGASVLGVDNAAAMIETAKAHHPDLDFRLYDAGKELSRLDADCDIVFSNACIQWIPEHATLIQTMFRLLRPGGMLAIQIPMPAQEPIHQILRELATSDPWRAALGGLRCFYTLDRSQYIDLLAELTPDYTVWETIYHHRLGSHEDIMEWYRGTGLRPYLARLAETRQEAFLKDVRDRVVRRYPPQRNGEIIFRFPRFFMTATAPAAGPGQAVPGRAPERT